MKYVQSSIEKAIELESKRRHDLANQTQAAMNDLRTRIDRIEQVVMPKQELISAFHRFDDKFDEVLQKLSAVVALEVRLGAISDRLGRVETRLDKKGLGND